MARQPESTESIAAIAARLRQTREALGLKQVAWCKLVGISTQAWNNSEHGRSRISLEHALKVCQATGVSLDWIYRGLASHLPAHIATKIAEMQGAGERRKRA